MAHIFERLIGHYFLLDMATEVTTCPETSQLTAYTGEIKPNIFIGVPRVWEKIYAGVNAAVGADPEKGKAFNEAIDAALPIREKMTRGTATQDEIDTWNFLDQVAFQTVRGLIGLDEAEICITGAAPLPAEILAWFRAIGVPLTEGYGMSETTAVITWSNTPKPGMRRPCPRRRSKSPSPTTARCCAEEATTSSGISDSPTRPPRPSTPTDGSTPATSARSTTTAT